MVAKWSPRGSQNPLKMGSKFYCFLILFLRRFGCQNGAKIRAQSDKKTLTNQYKSRPHSYLDFGRILDRFQCHLLALGPLISSAGAVKSWVLPFSQTFKNGTKQDPTIEENPLKSEAKRLSKTFQKFNYFCDQFWEAKWWPGGSQNGARIKPEGFQKLV